MQHSSYRGIYRINTVLHMVRELASTTALATRTVGRYQMKLKSNWTNVLTNSPIDLKATQPTGSLWGVSQFLQHKSVQ